jgi:SAM-dependent methyltransferase
VSGASRFAGGDQAYLRDVQYRDASRLTARADLHARYGTAEVPWFEWVRTRLELFDGARVLDAGCGAGWLWAESSAAWPADVALVLCDLSPGMVDEAVGRASAGDRFASVDGRAVDVQRMPFDAGSFDRVVANHMLYHLPDPALGVAELARVVAADGVVVAATNGRRHVQELHEVEASVFGDHEIDHTVAMFGAENGLAILRDHFDDVRWLRYRDELRCTDPADVVAYSCSSPPGEDATSEQRAQLEAAIARCFEDGGGVMTITKDVGAFVCCSPRTE